MPDSESPLYFVEEAIINSIDLVRQAMSVVAGR